MELGPYKKINKPNFPKISIITVVFNSVNLIEKTIESVLKQDYPNIEYIIIDGGSKDGTIEIINKYKSKINYFLSEPDQGIYDAMNKGLILANGEWVNFMNSGDIFFSDNTIYKLVKKINKTAVIYFGGVKIDYDKFSRIQNPGPLKNIWKGMQFCHQSALISLKYHKKNLFEIKYKFSADHKFFYEAYKNKCDFVNSNQIVSVVITGGISESNRILTIIDSCNAICGRKLKLRFRFCYFLSILDATVRKILKIFLPEIVIRRLILNKFL